MAPSRCSAFVVDKTTKRNRKCKLHCYFRGVCYIHAQQAYRDSAIIIQKIWRGFQKRTKLENLYYKLPKELQINIMRYVREDHYIEKKWIPSVREVYKNRLFHYHAMKRDLNSQLVMFQIDRREFTHYMYALFTLERETQSKLDILLD